MTKEDLKRVLGDERDVRRNILPQRLKLLLGNGFAESIIEEDGRFYWTHFIKCPGNFRHNRKGLNISACANRHLLNEVNELKPSLLISVGGQCSHWLLRLAGSNYDWRSCVLDELSKGRIRELDICTLKLRTIFLIHPAERSGLGWHIDKRIGDLIRGEIASLIG